MSRIGFRRVAARLLRAELPASLNDAELLARFAASRDESAFAELVARYGGLVRGTARRYLGDSHAAEDVCQAAFLVLARKAGAGRWGRTVGPWLHATAVRLARKVGARAKPASAVLTDVVASRVDPAAAAAWAEVARALDDELAALPDRLRSPLILCYLQGHTRDEAAHAVGCSLAMLKRRLERGRNLLRDRLTRRGIALPAVGLGVLVSDGPIEAAAVHNTARAAVAFATSGQAPPSLAALVAVARPAGWVAMSAIVAGLVACAAVVFAVQIGAQSGGFMQTPSAQLAADDPAPESPDDLLPDNAVARLGSNRLRPGGSVERMAFSPDGSKLASWNSVMYTTDALTIWDTKSGRALRRVDLPGARVSQVIWTADGLGIALVRSSYDDPNLLIWEFTDEKAKKPEVKPIQRGGFVAKAANQQEPPPDNEYDACYTISPDGKWLAVGRAGAHEGKERAVRLDPLRTGVKVNELATGKEVAKHPDNCGELYFTPDSKTLVVFTNAKHLGDNKFANEQQVSVWDVATAKEKARFKAQRPVNNGRPAVALSNNILAIGLEKGDTALWDLNTGKDHKLATEHDTKKPGHGYGTYSVAFTPDGKWLLTGGHDEVTKVWEVESGKHLRTLARHYSWVETLATSPTGKLVASAGQDGLIRLWDVTTGVDVCPHLGHKYIVAHAALSPNGRTAVTAAWDNTLRWWNASTGAEQRVVTVEGGVMGLVVSPDGKAIVIATDDGKLRIWDAATGQETHTNVPADAKFETLAFTPDGQHLLTAHHAKLTIWEWPALKSARTIDLPKPRNQPGWHRCDSIAVSPDGKWLVTVGHRAWSREPSEFGYGSQADGVVDVWEFATGKRVRRLVDGQTTFRSGRFTADGQFVLIGSSGTISASDGNEAQEFKGQMNLLDPVAGRWLREFEVPPVSKTVNYRYHGASILSADGRTLYVSYSSGEVVAFEVATGKLRRTLTGHREYVGALGISADGKRLISGGREGIAIVWDVTLASAITPRGETDPDKLWQAVAGGEAREAYVAMAELVAAKDKAVDVIRKHVKPIAAAPSAADLDRVFKQLADDEFATRETASKTLREFGEMAVPGVRERFKNAESPEVRQRATAFLKEFERPTFSPTRVLQTRAVEVLEGLGTPAAKKYLAELAAGGAGTALTTDAAAALKRLDGR